MTSPSKAAKAIIRPAGPSDAIQIAELSGQLGYPATESQIEGRLREVRGTTDRAIFVAELGSRQLAGMVDVFVSRAITKDKFVEVAALVVREDIRASGIGRLLMDRAEEWACGHGCDEVRLRSNVLREGAHRFYERRGYEHYKTQKAYRKVI
jgi:GNAT superfamily N-acetyltransferase